MKKWLYILPAVIIFLGCRTVDDGLTTIDLGSFKITIPKGWKYIKRQGEDSFVGDIQINKTSFLTFDCSKHGYANSLLMTENEYLSKREWYNGQVGWLGTDSKIILHQPNSSDKIKFPKADFIADIINEQKTSSIPIEIPAVIKSHYIQLDSITNYTVKTIWPKITGKGMTGIYIHSRTSSFNFQMNGKNLAKKEEMLALQAFKTIEFK